MCQVLPDTDMTIEKMFGVWSTAVEEDTVLVPCLCVRQKGDQDIQFHSVILDVDTLGSRSFVV